MKFLKVFLVLLAFSFSSCSELQQALGTVLENEALTTGEISSGLKEALEIGIGKGADQLSAVDGFFKSPYKILYHQKQEKSRISYKKYLVLHKLKMCY